MSRFRSSFAAPSGFVTSVTRLQRPRAAAPLQAATTSEQASAAPGTTSAAPDLAV